jgi:hypothetical protein
MPASTAPSSEGASPVISDVSSPSGSDQPSGRSLCSLVRGSDPLAALESILKRDEADILFVVGNIALVALEIIEWPVAALALAVHAMARARFKALRSVAEVAEEAE